MVPIKGPFSSLLVAPVTMVTLNDYRSVAIMIVPTAMQPAIRCVELGAGSAIIITVAIVIISVAADAEAESLRACHGRRCNHDGR